MSEVKFTRTTEPKVSVAITGRYRFLVEPWSNGTVRLVTRRLDNGEQTITKHTREAYAFAHARRIDAEQRWWCGAGAR